MDKLKFAIIGCGRISYKHVEALIGNINECVLIATCDVIKERAEDKAASYEKEVNLKVIVYTDYKEMLEKEDIDVVTIATESGYHAKITNYCLKKGKHVIVEKPMALLLSDADEMIKNAEKNNVKLAVCHQNRFNLPIQKLRKAIEDGRFGKIINGTARILWNRNDDYYAQAPWRGTKALDGGTLMNQCIHNIDLLQWMMNSEVGRVYCERDTFLRNIEMEDFGAILIRFKNGCIGLVEGSACVYPGNLEETLSIFGEKGTVVIGGLAVNKINVWKFEDSYKGEEEEIINNCKDVFNVYGEGHTMLFKNFINSIKNDEKLLVSGIEGKKALEIILRAYSSSI